MLSPRWGSQQWRWTVRGSYAIDPLPAMRQQASPPAKLLRITLDGREDFMARVIQLARLWILGARRGRGGFGEVFEAVDAAGMEEVVQSRPEGLEVALPLGTVGSGGRTRTYDQAVNSRPLKGAI
jgi:hypothetical protein